MIKTQSTFVVFQSLSHVRLSATPWTAARQASLSFTISYSLLGFTSTELVMPSNHLVCWTWDPSFSPPFQDGSSRHLGVCPQDEVGAKGRRGAAPWVCVGSAVMASLASCGHGCLCWSALLYHVNPERCFCAVLCGPPISGGSSHVVPGLAGWPAAFGCGPSLLCSQQHETPAWGSPGHLGMSGQAFHSPWVPWVAPGAKLRSPPADPRCPWPRSDAGVHSEWSEKLSLSSPPCLQHASHATDLGEWREIRRRPSHSPLGARRDATFLFCVFSGKNLPYITFSSGFILALCLRESWFMRKRNKNEE